MVQKHELKNLCIKFGYGLADNICVDFMIRTKEMTSHALILAA